jgi:predicted porin
MKKSVFALAILGAAAGTAHAQTNVTVYGVVTAGINYTDKVALPAASGPNTTGPKLSLDSGQYTQSRLGFRGTEDLGNGLKAAFTLEGGVTIDNGASGQGGATFGRKSTIGFVSDSFGTLDLGRRKDFLDEVANQYSSANRLLPFVGKVHGNNMDRSTGERANNMIYYSTPVVGGFRANASYGFGETAGSISTGQSYGFGAMYDNGPFGIGFGYWKSKLGATPGTGSDAGAASNAGCNTAGLGAAGDTCLTTWMLGANYDIGSWTLRGSYSQAKQPLITDTTVAVVGTVLPFTSTAGSGAYAAGGLNNSKVKIIDVGADYVLGAWKFKGSLIQSRFDFVGGPSGAPRQGRLFVIAAGVDYSLSKRTTLYAMAANMRASDMYSPGLTGSGAPGADNSQNAILGGIMHTF